MKLSNVPSPEVWFTHGQKNAAERFIPAGGPVLGVGPAANWQGKMWPAERFIEIIRHITGPSGILPGARVAVFAAPGEENVAEEVLHSVPPEKQINMIAKADAGTVAAALARCALYIGNDSGLMHTAAAAGVPTLGLFGPSWPHLYRPWGAHADYVSTPENYDALVAYEDYDPATAPSLMTSLSVEAVRERLEKFRAKLKGAA
jgi:heptosyltransferase-3